MAHPDTSPTRLRLLDAAWQIIRSRQLHALTLDRVAKEAGVSKGGLLHHFGSKEALIEGLLNHLFDTFEQRVAYYYDAEPPASGRWLRAYIHASFEDNPLPVEFAALLLNALAQNDRLLQKVQDYARRWQQRLLEDGLSPARVIVIQQATDSYWLDQSLHLTPDSAVSSQAVMQELLDLAGKSSE